MASALVQGKQGCAVTAVKYVLIGIGLLAVLLIGSCAVIGYTTVKAVETVSPHGTELVKQIEAAADRQALKVHNDRMNREAAYGDYESDYGGGSDYAE